MVRAALAVALAGTALHVGAQAKVDTQPGNPAYGFGSVWVPSSATGTLDRVDPKTLHVVARIRSTKIVTPPPNQYFDSVAVTKKAVWHASDAGNVVVRVDPRTNKVVAKIAVGGRPDEIAAGPSDVYVGLFQTSTVERISGNRVVRRRDVGGLVYGVAYARGSVWVVSGTGPTLLALDPVTLAVRKRISVQTNAPFVGGFSSAWWVSADPSTICVGNLQQNAVTIVDPAAAKVVKQVVLPYGRQPFSVAAANGSCWVTNDGGVFHVSRAGAVAAAKLPHSVFSGVAAGGWVTLAGRNAVLKVS